MMDEGHGASQASSHHPNIKRAISAPARIIRQLICKVLPLFWYNGMHVCISPP